jgi:hypothetical protein
MGFSAVAVLNIAAINWFQNQIILPAAYILIILLLSWYFKSSITSKILYALIFSALLMASESLTGVVLTHIFQYPIEDVQSSAVAYAVGLFGSKLFALMIIYLIRIFFPAKKCWSSEDKWFNVLMLLLPLQSLLLCFVVQGFIAISANGLTIFLGEAALASSFILIGITTFIINNQLKAMMYKRESEEAARRLQIQMEHYDELYSAQKEIRAIRHDMKDRLVALYGLLESGRVDEAMKYIAGSQDEIQLTERVIDTGFPDVDAILNTKINKAAAIGVLIECTIMIDKGLSIDQFDLAIVLAKALDNAVEAASSALCSNTDVKLVVSCKSEYISILVENYTSDKFAGNPRPRNTDAENHGFGIPQMRAIASKYNGALTTVFDEKTGKFALKILLENRSR